MHPGPTRAYRGSPESSPQRENICRTIPRPRRSRSGETGWGATNAYIKGANYLWIEEMSLMPRRLLCPGLWYSYITWKLFAIFFYHFSLCSVKLLTSKDAYSSPQAVHILLTEGGYNWLQTLMQPGRKFQLFFVIVHKSESEQPARRRIMCPHDNFLCYGNPGRRLQVSCTTWSVMTMMMKTTALPGLEIIILCLQISRWLAMRIICKQPTYLL